VTWNMTGSFCGRAADMARQTELQGEQANGSAAKPKNNGAPPCLHCSQRRRG